MNNIKLNHWFINGNEMAICLAYFYVSVTITNKDNEICFIVKVAKSDRTIKELTFEFYSLEKAITFVEGVVSGCKTPEEVMFGYCRYHADEDRTFKKER